MNGNRNNQRPQNNRPQGQIVQNAQQQVRNLHPEDYLQVHAGSVSCLDSNLWFSEKALNIAESLYPSLTKDNDRTRFRVGGARGYKNHKHALGHFLRATHEAEVRYLYQNHKRRFLDHGGSRTRMVSQYMEVGNKRVSVASLGWSRNPNFGVKDDIREEDFQAIYSRKCGEHNEREYKMNPDPENLMPEDPKWFYCSHATGEKAYPRDCGCMVEPDYHIAVESAYYDNVLPGIIKSMVKSYVGGKSVPGYLILNNYYGTLLAQVKKDPNAAVYRALYSTVTNAVDEVKYQDKFYGCEGLDGTPESTHTIRLNDQFEFKVRADVHGNSIPYMHSFPKLLDEDTYGMPYEYLGVKYIILFERLRKTQNADVNFETIKMRVTLYDQWTPEEREAVPMTSLGNATLYGMLQHLPDNLKRDIEQIKLAAVMTCATKPVDVPMTAVTTDKEAVSIVNECYESEKVLKAKDKTFDPVKHKARMASEFRFIRWLSQQTNRVASHSFILRKMDGELWLVAARRARWFMGMFVSTEVSETAMAKVSDVIDAYLSIGVKGNQTSIRHAMVSDQRNATKSMSLFTTQDAFIIARLLRMAEEHRFEAITKDFKQ